MAEMSTSDPNTAGAHTPDSPSSRDERYTARTARANMDDISNVESILGDLTLHTTTPGLYPLGADTSGVGREPTVEPETTSQDPASPISGPKNTQGHRAVFRERHATLQAHHQQLALQLEEGADLLLRLPPFPTLFTNPFSPSYTATAGTAATSAQSQPLAPPSTQPSVPVTLRAQPLQVAPTHAT